MTSKCFCENSETTTCGECGRVIGSRLENKIQVLRLALNGLRHGEDCFCEVAIGNPNFKGRHTTACLEAELALGATK